MTCYKQSLMAREYFWRNEIKLKNLDEVSDITEYNDPMSSNYINTEIELLVHLCDKIRKSIKCAYSLLIFKDVKARLKTALNELNSLKKRITGDIFRQAVILENNENIDEEDKAFISQVFMQVSHKSIATHLTKVTTIKDQSESSPVLLFNKYGIKNFDKVLEAIGTDWDFDIFFIHQSTGHSIFILSKYLCQKWGIFEEFQIPEDVFDKFFQSVEKVRFT
jgi:hypothetical protein